MKELKEDKEFHSKFSLSYITRYAFKKKHSQSTSQPSYSRIFAFVYILNLIVGVGAIAMPKAFALAGWLLGLFLLIVLALLSYMTATYVIEAMATANAYGVIKRKEKERAYSYAVVIPRSIQTGEHGAMTEESIVHRHKDTIEDAEVFDTSLVCEETSPLLHTDYSHIELYQLNTRYEMGDMANMFFNPIARLLYYIAIIVYLYGDMAIYIATVPKSLANITCVSQIPSQNISIPGSNISNRTNGTHASNGLCFGMLQFMNLYRIYIVSFILLLGPLIFFDLSKSKWLQLFTAILRNISLIMMILIAAIQIGVGKRTMPSIANFSFVPNLFGVIIYAFMCQHSIPGMITPLNTKRKVNLLLFVDYFSILCYYATLAFTAAFRFNADAMEDVYTLNFKNTFPTFPILSYIIYYFLALFPVFTLSTSFPIIGITLRENLKSLWSQFRPEKPWVIDRLLFPILALVPPIIIAFFTMDVELLVGITGSYAGVCVQYLIPVALVFASRRVIIRERGKYMNPHKSPFSHWLFLLMIVIWSVICLIVMTIDRIDSYLHFLTPNNHNNVSNYTIY
ncbi:hypothetical protein LOD99_4493 [Oopsacas minuta]|uniref:Amino acid transporter transmembrane domain-containing protein n=1 Tax=Oopsacas minuta TaxID=111878 RepID=A0AAV7JVG8_9METZ|nr:hypothetical protein LOD99_4493 [Oopsacas minuta]